MIPPHLLTKKYKEYIFIHIRDGYICENQKLDFFYLYAAV